MIWVCSTRALRFTIKGVGNEDTRELTVGHERDVVKNDSDNENEDTNRMRTTLAATSRVALFGESTLKRPSKSAMPIFGDSSLNMRTTRALYASTRHGILMDEQPVETYRSTLVVMTELNAATVYDFRVAAGALRCHEKLPPVDGRQQCFANSCKPPCAWALVDVLTSNGDCRVQPTSRAWASGLCHPRR